MTFLTLFHIYKQSEPGSTENEEQKQLKALLHWRRLKDELENTEEELQVLRSDKSPLSLLLSKRFYYLVLSWSLVSDNLTYTHADIKEAQARFEVMLCLGFTFSVVVLSIFNAIIQMHIIRGAYWVFSEAQALT